MPRGQNVKDDMQTQATGQGQPMRTGCERQRPSPRAYETPNLCKRPPLSAVTAVPPTSGGLSDS